jgi:hypothetical protein
MVVQDARADDRLTALPIVGDVVHFGLGDVMGKGTGAALLGAGRLVSEHDHPSTLLDAIALLTVETLPTDDVTAVAPYRRAVS